MVTGPQGLAAAQSRRVAHHDWGLGV